ncbi:Mobile element protein [Candidatus Enterovibrio altilux]|uniref:Mobile element protein n=1 Tax=Candidatus Enterovibrio altilux TaxID=1927128 RepID=A0A291B950_9GAMM|nr:Mobile element protein [Candidatus Enterovibrio luxaltus]
MNNLRYETTKKGNHGRPSLFSDLAITTALVAKCVFSMQLKSLQGFINSMFKPVQLPLSYPHYSYISKLAKTVSIVFKKKNKGSIQHLTIDSMGLKIYDEGE